MIIERIGVLDINKIKNDTDRLYITEKGWLFLYLHYSKVYECDMFVPVDYTLTIISDYEYDYDKGVYTPVYKRIYDCKLSDYIIDMDMNDLKKVEVCEQNGKITNNFIMR